MEVHRGRTLTGRYERIKDIFDGEEKFTYPKSVRLIQRIVGLYGNKNSIILDFFAGSGTTGHAVMKLNAEDGGKRTFILCTNNENNICREVTYERIKRVIARDNFPASLKYFKVDYIPISDKRPARAISKNRARQKWISISITRRRNFLPMS